MKAKLNRQQFREPNPFSLGDLRITDAACEEVSDADATAALAAHCKAHWGLVDDILWETNDMALELRGRVRSVHRASRGALFWVVTDLARRSTMVALALEYE